MDYARRVIRVYTDGSCRGNPGPGGWAWAAGVDDFASGCEAHTTNQRMELLAVIEALQSHEGDIEIVSDSNYVVKCFHDKWWSGWQRRGWKNSQGQAVANRDLWEALDGCRLPGVPLVYVKGHSGDPDNDRCDAIAVAFSKGQRPALAAGEVVAAPAPERDLAPAPLQELLTRLELADRLAERGYGLSVVELAQLVQMPLRQLEGKTDAWNWRDWLVQPAGDGRWRLARATPGLGVRE